MYSGATGPAPTPHLSHMHSGTTGIDHTPPSTHMYSGATGPAPTPPSAHLYSGATGSGVPPPSAHMYSGPQYSALPAISTYQHQQHMDTTGQRKMDNYAYISSPAQYVRPYQLKHNACNQVNHPHSAMSQFHRNDIYNSTGNRD